MPETPEQLPENLAAVMKAAEIKKITNSTKKDLRNVLTSNTPSSTVEGNSGTGELTGGSVNGTVEGKDMGTIPGGKSPKSIIETEKQSGGEVSGSSEGIDIPIGIKSVPGGIATFAPSKAPSSTVEGNSGTGALTGGSVNGNVEGKDMGTIPGGISP